MRSSFPDLSLNPLPTNGSLKLSDPYPLRISITFSAAHETVCPIQLESHGTGSYRSQYPHCIVVRATECSGNT